MATASEIADLITAGMQGPTGNDDTGYRVGRVIAWDELNQLNSIQVGMATLNNLQTINSGIGIQYQPGDSVMIQRVQTQYFVLGKVSSPGAPSVNQIQSQTISTYETTSGTGYTDLLTTGPQVAVNVGSSKRCLVMVSAFISVSGTIATNGGWMGGVTSVEVSGRGFMIAPGNGSVYAQSQIQALVPFSGPVYGNGSGTSVSGARLFTASDGFTPGLTTFTMRYKSLVSSPVCGFQQRTLTVIPF